MSPLRQRDSSSSLDFSYNAEQRRIDALRQRKQELAEKRRLAISASVDHSSCCQILDCPDSPSFSDARLQIQHQQDVALSAQLQERQAREQQEREEKRRMALALERNEQARLNDERRRAAERKAYLASLNEVNRQQAELKRQREAEKPIAFAPSNILDSFGNNPF